jgi:hypothetical protein
MIRKYQRKTALDGSGLRWEDNIRIDFQEMWYMDAKWIEMAMFQRRSFVNNIVNLWIP